MLLFLGLGRAASLISSTSPSTALRIIHLRCWRTSLPHSKIKSKLIRTSHTGSSGLLSYLLIGSSYETLIPELLAPVKTKRKYSYVWKKNSAYNRWCVYLQLVFYVSRSEGSIYRDISVFSSLCAHVFISWLMSLMKLFCFYFVYWV